MEEELEEEQEDGVVEGQEQGLQRSGVLALPAEVAEETAVVVLEQQAAAGKVAAAAGWVDLLVPGLSLQWTLSAPTTVATVGVVLVAVLALLVLCGGLARSRKAAPQALTQVAILDSPAKHRRSSRPLTPAREGLRHPVSPGYVSPGKSVFPGYGSPGQSEEPFHLTLPISESPGL